MQITILLYYMLSLLQILSFALNFIRRLPDDVNRLCLDSTCTARAFRAPLLSACATTKTPKEVDVHGKTSDGEYYIIKIDRLYYIKSACVDLPKTVPEMKMSSPVGDFLLFDHYSGNLDTDKLDANFTIEVEDKDFAGKLDEKLHKSSNRISEALYEDEKSDKNKIIDILDWNDFLKKPYFLINQFFTIWDPTTLEQNLKIASFRNELYYQIVIILLLGASLFRFLKRNKNSSHYQIEKKQLEKLFLDRIKILEKNVDELKIVIDKKSKELSESNSYLEELKEKIANNAEKNNKELTAPQEIEIDGQIIPGTIPALKSIIDELSEKVKILQNEKKILDDSQFENKSTVNKILSTIFENQVFEKEDLDEALKTLQDLPPEQIFQSVSSINEKIKAYKSNDMSTLYTTELKDLKEKYQKSLQKIVKLEEDNKEAKFKKYEIETELKVFKNHYKESENTLQEKFNQERMKVVDLERRLESMSFDSAKVPDLSKIIADLKFEISSLEAKSKSMKDQHLLDLNQQYTLNKKLERELDRTKLEKEKYRTQLLKVLNDNQIIENEKDHVSESNFNPKTIISSHHRSESPIKSSFAKNEQNFEQMMPPPPPPPPMLFSVHPMANQPFIPNETSSPRLEIPNFYVSFTNSPSMQPPFDMFGQEYDPNSNHPNK